MAGTGEITERDRGNAVCIRATGEREGVWAKAEQKQQRKTAESDLRDLLAKCVTVKGARGFLVKGNSTWTILAYIDMMCRYTFAGVL